MINYLNVPEQFEDVPEWLRRISKAVNGTINGKTNNRGAGTLAITLTANSATTTVTFSKDRIGVDTIILFMPTTANAAGAISSLYVSARDVAAGTMTLTHANTATVDRTFNYVLVG